MAQKKIQGLVLVYQRRGAIDSNQSRPISIRRQCDLLSINRSMLYYEPARESDLNLQLMREIDEIHLNHPFMGVGMMTDTLNRDSSRTGPINHKRVERLMKKMAISAVYPKPKTSTPQKGHMIYPYLLRDREIHAVNEVWCSDITYIPMAKGYLYLVAIMDWYLRFVLSWKVSNTMETDFCLEALEEAVSQWGKAEIFNTDQGSQFTAHAFSEAVESAGMKMSMDGRGRWIDNRFIERLWRSLKYEEIYLHAYDSIFELEQGASKWFSFYRYQRPHSSLGKATPFEVYSQGS